MPYQCAENEDLYVNRLSELRVIIEELDDNLFCYSWGLECKPILQRSFPVFQFFN